MRDLCDLFLANFELVMMLISEHVAEKVFDFSNMTLFRYGTKAFNK